MVRVWYKNGSKVLLFVATGRNNLAMKQLFAFISQPERNWGNTRYIQARPHGCHAELWLGESASGLGIASQRHVLGASLDSTLRHHDEFPSIERLDFIVHLRHPADSFDFLYIQSVAA